MITDEQQKRYLDNPNQCPKCSGSIFETDVSFSDIYVWRTFACRECQLEFMEEYSLTKLIEIKN